MFSTMNTKIMSFKAANKVGISREWLSKTKSKFVRHHRDPCSLEPEVWTSHDTSKKKRVSEEKIKFWKWGIGTAGVRKKIFTFLFTENGINSPQYGQQIPPYPQKNWPQAIFKKL